jgi:hypothetical protein
MPDAESRAASVVAGVMFEAPRELDHDGWVSLAKSSVALVTRNEIADAFLASLSSRRLDLRSALGSYAVARVLTEHAYEPWTPSGRCRVCGQYAGRVSQDLNMLSFERFKWGGVRRDQIPYVAFDLEQFVRAPRLSPTDEDRALGRRLLAAARSAAPDTTATRLALDLRFLKGNKAEREMTLDALGVCGILETNAHRGYLSQFVPDIERKTPPKRFIERVYPLSWWTAADGVNDDAVEWFLPGLQK